MLGKKCAKKIRKYSFSKSFSADSNLNQKMLYNNYKEFVLLRNPIVQNIYNYQINYILNFSEEWFGRKLVDILDWGCGDGYVSYLLKSKYINFTSCDISGYGPLLSMEKINVIELKHDYILPFNNSSFDVVLSFGVLEHVANDLESLREIRRILKRNGLFFCFYLPYKLSYTQNIQNFRGKGVHDILYGENDVKNLLKKTNLTLIDIWHRALLPKKSFNPPFYHSIEKIDNWFCNYSPLKYFATNIEFVAYKQE